MAIQPIEEINVHKCERADDDLSGCNLLAIKMGTLLPTSFTGLSDPFDLNQSKC